MAQQTLGAMLRESCLARPTKVAMIACESGGTRELTYGQLCDKVHAYASVLHEKGLRRGDDVAILSENCLEWAVADWACQTLGLVVTPIYPSLPADQAQFIAADCGSKLAVVGDAKQEAKLTPVKNLIRVRLRDVPDSLDDLSRSAERSLSREDWEKEIDATKPDDVATMVYTSGTSGRPKGAMLTHRACTWVCGAVLNNIPITADDVLLSFLPMNHVFERIDGQFLPIGLGGTVAYAKSLASLAGDIARVRPTTMMVVPRFLEATRDRILEVARKRPPFERRMFNLALSQGARKARNEWAPLFWLTDRVVGGKIRGQLGGRIRFLVSGGAALPQHLVGFYHGFGIKLLQGYGLTETAAGIAVNHPDRNDPTTVGEVLPGMECKLADDGEILLRGPAIMTGYFNLPVETEEALDTDGWFHTGDVGEFAGKRLKITDRKKDLIVLGNGKNVAPQPIENELRASEWIAEAVVLGDGMDHCVALIVPEEGRIRSRLKRKDDVALVDDPEVQALIKSEVQRINANLAPYEMVKRHALIDHPFSVEGGELTPTLKVKRRVVSERYADVIRGLMG